MQLVPCNPPAGRLEPAPSTSLGGAGTDGTWDGFWSLDDDGYYARHAGIDGGVHWFRIVDASVVRHRRRLGTAVLAFPRGPSSVPRMIVGRYRGQAMIVGRRARRPAGDSR